MKNIIYILVSVFMCFACNKVELPDTEKETDKTDQHETPPSEDGCLTVAEALDYGGSDNLLVEGFIVGYVKGTSINSGAEFSCPENVQNTNLLLADSPDENDPVFCMPVKLEKSGRYATREDLNLFDHPDFLGKKIIIDGILAKYFSKNGITRIYGYELFSIEDEQNTEDNEDGNEGNETPADSVEKPGINDEEEFIPDGRCKKYSNFSKQSFGSLK